MKIKFDPEELGMIYAFIGGLTYVQVIDRQKRRNLARIANKFGAGCQGKVHLNMGGWDYVHTLLTNAVAASSKALMEGHVKPEDVEKSNKTNQVFISVINKINNAYGTKLKNRNTELSTVLGNPKNNKKQESEGEVKNEYN